MVGITFRQLLLCAALTIAATLGCAAQTGGSTLAERQQTQLTKRSERVASQLVQARQAYYQSPNDSLSRVIYELEQQQKSIRKAIARLNGKSSDEQEIAKSDSAPAAPKSPSAAEADVADFENLASDNIKFLFRTSSRRYNLITKEINALIDKYATAHARAIESAESHDKATSIKRVEEHHAAYVGALEEASRIATEISTRSERLLTSKTNSLLGFADSLKIDTIAIKHNLLRDEMESRKVDSLSTLCDDVELAMFGHRFQLTMLLEAELAKYIQPDVADSLQQLALGFNADYTTFPPAPKPKRVDGTKYAGVKVAKKPKYVAVSSLPTIKVPSRGELYAIAVGNYQSLPSSTKPFKGTSPLSRELREDGRTYVYVGLYPTAVSAQEDLARLRELGFKQPELVMWRDGIRRDDFVDRNSAAKESAKQTLYRLEIAGATGALSDAVQEVIRQEAPRKEISKFSAADGSTIFTLGIFTQENEAHKVASAIGNADTTLTVTVSQIGKR